MRKYFFTLFILLINSLSSAEAYTEAIPVNFLLTQTEYCDVYFPSPSVLGKFTKKISLKKSQNLFSKKISIVDINDPKYKIIIDETVREILKFYGYYFLPKKIKIVIFETAENLTNHRIKMEKEIRKIERLEKKQDPSLGWYNKSNGIAYLQLQNLKKGVGIHEITHGTLFQLLPHASDEVHETLAKEAELNIK